MKRLTIKYFVGGVMILALASSCKKQLDKFPNDRIATSQAFVSVRDAKAWNAAEYATLRGNFYGAFTYTQDIQADQLNASIDYGNRNGFPHRWEGFEATDGAVVNPWAGFYGAITNINLAIGGFEKITAANATEQADLDRYKSENYAFRAYYYSELIKRFAKPYEPATAASDEGVPIVTEYDVNAKPARASVKEVYDFILADITKAKTGLAGVAGAQGSNKWTIDGVTALEARVRLYMQDWAGAKTAADAVIATNKYPLINTQAAYTAYWAVDTKTEDIMQLFTSLAESSPAVGGVYLGFRSNDNTYRPDWVPSQWVIDKYAATDIRKAAFFAAKPVNFTTGTGTMTLVNKYPGNPALYTGTTNYVQTPKFFRIAEMYLISAEAGARGTADADGLVKLNALRVARGLLPLVGLVDNALFAEVKDERFRELAFEGFRLWDLKRWHEGFTRSAPQNTNFLTVGTGFTTLSIPADHPKFVWGIPSRDIQTNPNLKQNTGW